jgi:alanine racemase
MDGHMTEELDKNVQDDATRAAFQEAQSKIVDQMVEIRLKDPKNDFLKVRETLTRIGIGSKHQKKLFQSCHILCKYKTRYFITHFKLLFKLDGKPSDFTENDLARQNTIANLLASWELIELVNPDKSKEPIVPISQIKIIPYSEKKNYELVTKYTIGNKKN